MAVVLFSTLGMTDPIKNDYDGPFLHIIRHYRPDKCHLFMTQRVCELADQDNRYLLQAAWLCDKEGFQCEFIELRQPEIDNPQQFDIFYPIFEKELLAIHNENPGSQILINLSSGTPQMKSACHLLALTAPFPVTPIQVTTPNEAENYGSVDYNIENSWNNDIDNHPEMKPPHRAKKVEAPNLRFLFLREAAIHNIEAYNYTAALNILQTVPDFIPEPTLRLLKAAQHRRNMDLSEAEKESVLADYDLFPIKSSDAKGLFEYLLVLGLQQKSGQLMDFVRGISPALTKLFECFLEKKCRRHVKRDFCQSDRHDRNHWVLKRNKIKELEPQLLAYYDSKFSPSFRDSDLSCAVLLPMIEYECGPGGQLPNEAVVKKAQDMRRVEERIRNSAAHTITSIKEEHFGDMVGISSRKLLQDMQWLFKYTFQDYFGAGESLWDSYDTMNEQIIHRLKSGSK